MKRFFWRYGPLAIAVGTMLLSMGYISSRPFVESYHVSFLLMTAAWVAVAAWVSIQSDHVHLAAYGRSLAPATILMYAVLVMLLAALVYLNRRTVPMWVVPLVLALLHLVAAAESPRRRVVLVTGAIILTAVLTELSLLALVRLPFPATIPLRRSLYINGWRMIQTEPACSKHDRELGYTLRPGECRFANQEFDTQVRVNRLGVRDDDASLENPEVVILGDSYAMGWGVSEEATFGRRLEEMTGLRVLEAGISSYGTARELALLRRIDTQDTRYLIIQYNSNDILENLAFVENGYGLVPRDSLWFEELLREGVALRRYYPGRATAVTFTDLLLTPVGEALTRAIHGPTAGRLSPRDEAVLFRDVMEASGLAGSEMKILIMDFDVYQPRSDPESSGQGSAFLQELRGLLGNDARWNNVRILDLMPFMVARDYFQLDPHANATGHDKVARLLFGELCSIAADDEAAGRKPISGCEPSGRREAALQSSVLQ